MTEAAELRAEAAFLRDRLAEVTDPVERAELAAFIEELERLARSSDNGDAQVTRPDRDQRNGSALGEMPIL